MKLSDWIASYIESKGICTVFAFTGGSSAHLIDSVAKNKHLQYICHQHEQASAMAADAYARISGKIGVVIATSGPGATNLLTGCAGAFYDSVPLLIITGQVASDKQKRKLGVRQLGFQETDVVSIFSSVTKYAVSIDCPESIRYEMEKAYYIATHGRKGPVLIDLPDDFQRADIDENQLRGFSCNETDCLSMDIVHETIKSKLQIKKKPLFVIGQGVHSSGCENDVVKLVHDCKVPAVFTWGANDIMSFDDEYYAGTIGINGTTYGNRALKEADLVMVLGVRFDSHMIRPNKSIFGDNSYKILVEIDEYEIAKFKQWNYHFDIEFCLDICELVKVFPNLQCDTGTWTQELNIEKRKTSAFSDYKSKHKQVGPLSFFYEISKYADDDAIITLDTGCSLAWFMQGFRFKKNQRCISEFNHTAMGYSLPAATGARYAASNRQVICVTGDGGLQMNIQELVTVAKNRLNIKIILIENRGYGMIRQTQDKWIEGRHEAADEEHGLVFPDFKAVAQAYGLKVIEINHDDEVQRKLEICLQMKESCFCIVRVSLHEEIVQTLD